MKTNAANIISGLFILLFVYTALSKLLAFEKFRFVLRHAPVIGKHATLVALFIPIVELWVVALFFITDTARQGIIAGISLLVVFTIYLAFMVLTDPNLPCSCGGVIQQMSWRQHIVFNTLFIGVGITWLYLKRNSKRRA
jgi:hypothetical protein